MVKKIITSAFVMLSLSSVANAGALFSADKTLSSSEKIAEAPDWFVETQTNNMAIKSLDGDKEYGFMKNNMVPLEQSHDNDVASYHTLSHQEDYWQNVTHWKTNKNSAKHTKKSKKS